jgi:polar amino acid transport system permease protein
MLKNTSLAYVISTKEIFFQTEQLSTASFRYFEPLLIVSLYYLAMTSVATYFQGHLERYFGRGFSRNIRGPGFMQRALTGAMRRA